MERKKYTLEFKAEAVKLVSEQGYSQCKAAALLGIPPKNVRRWVSQLTNKKSIEKVTVPENEELKRLHQANN